MHSAAPKMSSGHMPFTQNTPPGKWAWYLLMKSITGSVGLRPWEPCRSCVYTWKGTGVQSLEVRQELCVYMKSSWEAMQEQCVYMKGYKISWGAMQEFKVWLMQPCLSLPTLYMSGHTDYSKQSARGLLSGWSIIRQSHCCSSQLNAARYPPCTNQ